MKKLLSRDTRRGTQKKREGANTNTTPSPKRANPERTREEKTEADGNGNGTRPGEEGRTEAPEPT